MALLEDNYTNHPVHQFVSQLSESLSSAADNAVDATDIDYLDGLNQAVSYIEKRLDSASPVLNSAAKLNQLQKNIQGSLNELNQYVANGNSAHLTNSYNQIDAALNYARSLISISDSAEGVSVSDSVSFKRKAEKIISDIKEKADLVSSQMNEILEDIKSSDEKVDEIYEALKALDSKVSVKFEEIEAEFSENESRRDSRFEENQERFNEAFNALESSLKETSESLVSTISEKKEEAEQIVRLVGNIGLTGNYRGIAERERSSANLMRWIALGCFSLMFLVIGATLIFAVKEGFDPWLTAFRFTAGLVLIIPASYAARESSKHRSAEEKNKRTELELASIDAYLENLPEEEKHRIKSELSTSFFGQSLSDEDAKSSESVSAKSIIELLKDAIAALGKVGR